MFIDIYQDEASIRAIVPTIKVPYLSSIYPGISYDTYSRTLTIQAANRQEILAITYVLFHYIADLISIDDAKRMIAPTIQRIENGGSIDTIYAETQRLWYLLRGNDL